MKNRKGETPIDNVSAPWSDEQAGVYRIVGNLIGEKLDLERIRKTRPGVLKLLKEHSSKATGSKAASAIDPKAASEAAKLLHNAIEKGNVAGGAHLVVRNGRTIHFEVGGKRDIEDGQPFEKDTLLRLYSMSKPITPVAATTLFEQGKFKLDDPIPEFKETTVLVKDGDGTKTVPAKRQITVRDVFRRTTGYSYGDGNPGPRGYYEKAGMRYRSPAGMYPPKMTIERAAAALARIPAQHHPGERFTCGLSTDLLGRLIEVWSGQTLAEYLQQAIFTPLEMPDMGFSVPVSKRNSFASCHTLRDGKLAIIDKSSTSEFHDGFEFLVRQRVPSDHSLAGRLFPVIYRGIPKARTLSWNQFRGPNADGTAEAGNLPVEFDEVKNVRWNTPIPDSGWSSPVICEDEIWLTMGSDENKELRAICVDLEGGKVIRDVKVFEMVERKAGPAYKFDSPHLHSPTTPTPVGATTATNRVNCGSLSPAEFVARRETRIRWLFISTLVRDLTCGESCRNRDQNDSQLISPSTEGSLCDVECSR